MYATTYILPAYRLSGCGFPVGPLMTSRPLTGPTDRVEPANNCRVRSSPEAVAAAYNITHTPTHPPTHMCYCRRLLFVYRYIQVQKQPADVKYTLKTARDHSIRYYYLFLLPICTYCEYTYITAAIKITLFASPIRFGNVADGFIDFCEWVGRAAEFFNEEKQQFTLKYLASI